MHFNSKTYSICLIYKENGKKYKIEKGFFNMSYQKSKAKDILLTASSLIVLNFSVACTEQVEQTSGTKVTDIDHTTSKHQSIGNCWLYAAASWAESLHLTTTGNKVDLSETYWTFWHWHNALVNSDATEVQTGGWFRAWHTNNTASGIIAERGYMFEGDFIPREQGVEFSDVQKKALEFVNRELASGELKEPSSRTSANVQRVLEKAFGVNMDNLRNKIHSADSLVLGYKSDGNAKTLKDLVSRNENWSEVSYPRISDNNQLARVESSRKKILKRIFRALNAKQPVIISFHVDFNALDTSNGMFSYQTLMDVGEPGRQGGHMVVIEDYVVDKVPDGDGGYFSIEEGEVSDDLKEMAIEGELRYFVVKNSWGSYRPERGLINGESRLEVNYLNMAWDVVNSDGEVTGTSSSLKSIYLPKEF